jgi:hypothetical protein
MCVALQISVLVPTSTTETHFMLSDMLSSEFRLWLLSPQEVVLLSKLSLDTFIYFYQLET